MRNIHIIALAALGGGLSGGDRIFIEFARHWSRKLGVMVYVWEEGLEMCKREKLNGKILKINLIRVGNLIKLGFIFIYFFRIFLGLRLAFNLKLDERDYLYSASEFWMDALPAFILKLRYPNIKWVAAWFQTAPSPLVGFTEGEREETYRFRAFFYWFIQKTVKPLISNFADFILVNNDLEIRQFPKKKKVIVVLGAIKVDEIIKYQQSNIPLKNKKYLAVFQGRFHPQKGVLELIDIWKLVAEKIPNAKLAMIGDGPLMKSVKLKIKNEKLEKNIDLFGYLHDGDEKYSIFNNSKIVVHPSFYDSGGMASLEAMAFGLPCVGFNLDSYDYYYPKGMIKVNFGNPNEFATTIVKLSKNITFYKKTSHQASGLIDKHWSWNKRANDVLLQLQEI